MGDNDRSSSDPCESGCLVLRPEDNPLDCLQRFLRGLREGRRQKDMDYLALCLPEYTQEITAGVVDVFKVCFSKGIKWKRLFVDLAVVNQNRFLHLILSEARILQQFKEVCLLDSCDRSAALTNETAMELRGMMSSEQGLERLELEHMSLLPGVLSTLAQGLRANRVGALDFFDIKITERDVMVDGEIVIDNEQNSEGRDDEIAFFIEELRQNKSLKELFLQKHVFSDGTLSNLILALVGHPMLKKLMLRRNAGMDQNTRALCSLLDPSMGRCMLSELSYETHSSPPRKLNIGGLAEAIVRCGCLQYLNLSYNRLDIRDLATLLDAASRCRTLVTLDLVYNDMVNLNLLDSIMQTHTPSKLRRLSLIGNPLGDDDRAGLAKLLKDHPELQDFGFSDDEKSRLITPAIQYMLDLNRSGRALLTNPSTPLSVWAKVLERANRLIEDETDSDVHYCASDDRTERQASVIYALLQGPALRGRSPNE
jgi:hypothetical protein